MREKNRRLCWLWSLLTVAAVFAVIGLWLDLRYAQNDDPGILRAFMGYAGGEPVHFHIFIHGLLSWPLYALQTLWPLVPWFSVVQLMLLFVSCVVLIKGLLQCFVNAQRPLWLGFAAAAVLLAAFVMDLCVRVTFTQTAALLGAAAVMQCLSMDHANATRGALWRGLLGAACLAALSYALRQEALWPTLGFCALALGYALCRWYLRGGAAHARLSALLMGCACTVLLLGGLMGWRAAELAAQDPAYLSWQSARAQTLDYLPLETVDPEAFAQVGWTEGTVARAKAYFFLDTDISAEALIALREQAQMPRPTVGGALGEVWESLCREPEFLRTLWLLLGLWLCALLLIALRRDEAARPRWPLMAALAAGLVLLLLLLIYLGMQGRLPLRALRSAVLPFAALVLGLLPACLMPVRGRARVACALGCALCLGAAAWTVADMLPSWLHDTDAAAEVGDPVAVLDAYAASEPDMLFIHDLTLSIDDRMFPDVSEGVVHNVTCWGGWDVRSPASAAQFARWDIDLWDFDPETLLRDDVCIATGIVDPPPTLVLNYLEEKLGETVDYTLYGEDGGVYFFQFYTE